MNPARSADAGHERTEVIAAGAGYVIGCRCGWYEQDLPSKRRAYTAHARHVADVAPDAPVDLSTPDGRGKAAALAHRRARTALMQRHATELDELENAERARLGLSPVPTGAP